MTKTKDRFLPVILFMWICVQSTCIAAESVEENDSWSKLRINEILASNVSNIKDEDSEDEDWVEIHNGGDTPVNMGGMYFSDNPKKPLKYRIPSGFARQTTILPGHFKLFWFDNEPDEGPLHTTLKLSRKGETLLLTHSNGQTLIDSVHYTSQKNDISYGRDPDAKNRWLYMQTPSPLKPNISKDAAVGISPDPNFSHQDGFHPSPLSLKIVAPAGRRFITQWMEQIQMRPIAWCMKLR